MSKKAEELAWSLCEQYDPPYLRKEFAIKEATKLIDSELRKERSRCADKAIDWFDDGTYIDADSRDRLHDELRAAILAEEED